MSPIRSASIAVLASAVLATTLTGCGIGGEPQDTSPIVIAADLELSGASAPIGKVYQRALELKVDQMNASGVLGGRKIELRVKDNRSDAAESLRNINDFSGDAQVSAVIMGGCNECAVGAARTISDKRIPTIALASAGAVTEPVDQRRYVFKLAPNAVDSAAALTTELTRRNIRKVAVLHSADGYGQEGVAALRREFGKASVKLVAAEAVRTTDTEVSTQIDDLVEKRPQALILWTPRSRRRWPPPPPGSATTAGRSSSTPRPPASCSSARRPAPPSWPR